MLEESLDDQQIIERVAALDIGKAELVCCVRLPGPGGSRRRLQEVITYSTMTPSLQVMAERLLDLGVTRVVMEATSDYWKPPFYLLEAHGLQTWLVNANDVKHLPGRPKTNRLDAVWLCKVAERQMIRPSFVPPPPIRRLRDLTRYRAALVSDCTGEKNRVEKLLEDAQIKLSVVASDIFGVSGRDMMAALIAGQRDPKVLAQLARSRMRVKIPQLEEAFVGRFGEHHRFLLAKMLQRVDAISADIAEVDARIDAEIAPFADTVARLDQIPGVGGHRGSGDHRRGRPGHEPVSHLLTPDVVGEVRSRGQGVRRAQERPRVHWPRQPVPGQRAGRGRRRLSQDRHLPRRTLPAPGPAPRQQEGHGRGRPLHPGHRLAAALRPQRPLPRPWPRLRRQPPRRRPHQAQPHPPTRGTRVQGHPRTRGLNRHTAPTPAGHARSHPRPVTFIFGLDGVYRENGVRGLIAR